VVHGAAAVDEVDGRSGEWWSCVFEFKGWEFCLYRKRK